MERILLSRMINCRQTSVILDIQQGTALRSGMKRRRRRRRMKKRPTRNACSNKFTLTNKHIVEENVSVVFSHETTLLCCPSSSVFLSLLLFIWSFLSFANKKKEERAGEKQRERERGKIISNNTALNVEFVSIELGVNEEGQIASVHPTFLLSLSSLRASLSRRQSIVLFFYCSL